MAARGGDSNASVTPQSIALYSVRISRSSVAAWQQQRRCLRAWRASFNIVNNRHRVTTVAARHVYGARGNAAYLAPTPLKTSLACDVAYERAQHL